MKLSRIVSGFLGMAATLGFSAQAHADVSCPFTLYSVNLTADGWVNVTFTTPAYVKGYWLCGVAGSTVVNDGYGSKTIASDACKALFSTLLTLKMASRPISLVFHGPLDCNEVSLPASGTQPNIFPSNFLAM